MFELIPPNFNCDKKLNYKHKKLVKKIFIDIVSVFVKVDNKNKQKTISYT